MMQNESDSRIVERIAEATGATRAALVFERDNTLTVAAARGISADVLCVWLIGAELPASGVAREARSAFPLQVVLSEGWLLVGPRADGKPFDEGATQALASLAEPLGRLLAGEAGAAEQMRMALARVEARLRG